MRNCRPPLHGFVSAPGPIYFGVAAFDAARVRHPAFAANPGVLFRYDVIGVDSLEPL